MPSEKLRAKLTGVFFHYTFYTVFTPRLSFLL